MAALMQPQPALARAWNLSRPQALALVAAAKPLAAARGALIARRGVPLPGVFLLEQGVVKLSLRAADGDERILRVVAAGDTFGEPTALLGKPCLYDAVAVSETRLIVIAPSAIFTLLEGDARFARRLVLALARQAVGILTEFEAATAQRGAQRLAGYLSSLAAGAADPRAVLLPVSKTVIAALLGMKKETLSRLLHQFVSDGIIAVRRREIAILDPRRLGSAAHLGA